MRDVRPGPFRAWRRVAVAAAVALMAAALVPATQANGSDRVSARTAADGAYGSFSFIGGPPFSYTLAFYDDSLIVGGDIEPTAGRDDSAIRAWSGGPWTALGKGLATPVVTSLVVKDDTLIAAGNFTGAVDDTGTGLVAGTSKIAAFADGSWHSMGSSLGTGGSIWSIAVMDDTLYAGGDLADLVPFEGESDYIAQWGDDTWSPLGTGINAGTNIVLAAGDDTLYAGGINIEEAGGLATPGLAAWSDNTWHAPMPPADDRSGDDTTNILAMVVQDDTLYVGGNLYLPGGSASTRYIAAQADGTWHALGSGVDDTVTALAVDEAHGLVYAAGLFPNPRAADDTIIAQAFDTGTGEWIPLDDSSTTSPFSFNGSI
ncbi:MAG: hypothetical protein RL347_1614, partial [Actinomycetota bacterium]